MALLGSMMLMDPLLPSQQHGGLQHAVIFLQQEVTRPDQTLLKPTLPEKSEVDGGPVS